MKNHFARIGLNVPDDDVELDALPLSAEDASDRTAADGEAVLPKDLEEARELLRDEERRVHYRRVCLQYRAMADALRVLDASGASDSHRWRDRLVEFG